MGVVDFALGGGHWLVAVPPAASRRCWRLRAVHAPAPSADRRTCRRALVDRLRSTICVVALRRAARRPTSPGAAPTRSSGRFLLGDIPQAQREPLLIHYRAALRGEQRSFEYHSIGDRSRLLGAGRPATSTGAAWSRGGLSVALDVSELQPASDGHRPADRGAVDAVADATRALARSVDAGHRADGGLRGRAQGRRRAGRRAVRARRRRRRRWSPRPASGADLDGLELPLTGQAGATLEPSPRAEEVFVALRRRRRRGRPRVHASRTRSRAVLWHPVVRDRAGDRGARDRLAASRSRGSRCGISALIDLLGAEAAVAIGRADLLDQLEHLARTDALTGLPNRRYWEQQLPRRARPRRRATERASASRCSTSTTSRHYNDRRGHQAGDRLLRRGGGRLARRRCGPTTCSPATAARSSAVILPGLRSRRRRRAGRAPARGCTPGGESCSAGIAEWDGAEPPESAGRPRRRGALRGQARRARPRRGRAGRRLAAPIGADPAHPRAPLARRGADRLGTCARSRSARPLRVSSAPPRCARVRAPVLEPEPICGACAAALRASAPGVAAVPGLERVSWAAPYDGVARELVAALKFGGRLRLAG